MASRTPVCRSAWAADRILCRMARSGPVPPTLHHRRRSRPSITHFSGKPRRSLLEVAVDNVNVSQLALITLSALYANKIRVCQVSQLYQCLP